MPWFLLYTSFDFSFFLSFGFPLPVCSWQVGVVCCLTSWVLWWLWSAVLKSNDCSGRQTLAAGCHRQYRLMYPVCSITVCQSNELLQPWTFMDDAEMDPRVAFSLTETLMAMALKLMRWRNGLTEDSMQNPHLYFCSSAKINSETKLKGKHAFLLLLFLNGILPCLIEIIYISLFIYFYSYALIMLHQKKILRQ